MNNNKQQYDKGGYMSTTDTGCAGEGKPLANDCGEPACTSGTRNRYFPSKRLTPAAMLAEQAYSLDRRRLLNRAIHGWGVVYGFALEVKNGKLQVGEGLALDRAGRELVQTETRLFGAADFGLLDPVASAGECWQLRVHYAERLIAPVLANNPCDPCACEQQEWDRVCETVYFTLQRVACDTCCTPEPDNSLLECTCGAGPCAPAHGTGEPRSGAGRCICDHLTRLAVSPKSAVLSERGERLRVDLVNGVVLACVKLKEDECGKPTVDELTEACAQRRLVKRNDLLFDLIRGRDLTHIAHISWSGLHRKEVAWELFEKYFAPSSIPGLSGFTVRFSRDVDKATVTPDCFAITFLIDETEGGWNTPLRVPIVNLYWTPGNDLREVALVFDPAWMQDAILGQKTRFDKHSSTVELDIRGDYILDCNGQAIDASPRGLLPYPTGNGTPGGSYLSTFKLGPKRKPATAGVTS